jgi:hypothetical protein
MDAEADALRPEYEVGRMSGGVGGQYAAAYRSGTNLAPDVAEVFNTDGAVDEGADLYIFGGITWLPGNVVAALRRVQQGTRACRGRWRAAGGLTPFGAQV